MGRIAVTLGARLSLIVSLLAVLDGCQFTGELVAAGAGGASAAATANPAVGIAVGVSVNAGIDATFNYIQRKRQQAEQDAIAAQVATMLPGEQRPWKINHVIPIGDEHGVVVVVRNIPNALAPCKELAFSVDSGSRDKVTRHWYTTDACQDTRRWKWALAEPATGRWGTLQP
ncbi:MAG TPA: hypothetical protein VME47_08800 [Acetobacteraceae bacterium]|nr:hypothetical protein [Acetobacteraceae bacterium]